jgi:selenocysteine lyase/cysteine desulfurase
MQLDDAGGQLQDSGLRSVPDSFSIVLEHGWLTLCPPDATRELTVASCFSSAQRLFHAASAGMVRVFFGASSQRMRLIAIAVTLACASIVSVSAFLGPRNGADEVHAAAMGVTHGGDYTIPFLQPPSTPPPAFGHPMRSQFQLADGYVNFNSGSFGGPPLVVTQQQRAWHDLAESKPDPWYRGGYQNVTRAIREVLADYINANSSDVVLTENTSTAVNSLLRSFPFQQGDNVLLLSTAYDMVQNTLGYVAKVQNLSVVVANVSFPINDNSAFTESVQAALDASPIRLCIFSHITCEPAVIVPIEILSEMCAAAGAAVIIDGAHAGGQIAVDITDLQSRGVSAYAGNGQKWLYGAKSTAFLWADASIQQLLVPAVISNTQAFVAEFEYTGTRDYTPWCSLNATFNFRQWLGDANIKNYIKTLADEGANYLVQQWGTEIGVALDMSHALTNSRRPTNNGTLVYELTHAVAREYNMEVVVYQKPVGVFWTRLSTQIYLDMTDYQYLSASLLRYFGLQPSKRAGERLGELKDFDRGGKPPMLGQHQLPKQEQPQHSERAERTPTKIVLSEEDTDSLFESSSSPTSVPPSSITYSALASLSPLSSVLVEGHSFSFALGGMIDGAVVTCLEDPTIKLTTDKNGYFSFMAAVGESITLQLDHAWYTTTQTGTVVVPPEGLVGTQNEMTFQVTMTLVYDLLELIIPVKPNPALCQFCVTVCAYNKTLWDDPQGEANTSVTISPPVPGSSIFYFGVDASNHTNPFQRGLNATSLDGGVLVLNVPVSDQAYVITAHKAGKAFSSTTMRCAGPGRFVNGAPPHSPRATTPDEEEQREVEWTQGRLV